MTRKNADGPAITGRPTKWTYAWLGGTNPGEPVQPIQRLEGDPRELAIEAQKRPSAPVHVSEFIGRKRIA